MLYLKSKNVFLPLQIKETHKIKSNVPKMRVSACYSPYFAHTGHTGRRWRGPRCRRESCRWGRSRTGSWAEWACLPGLAVLLDAESRDSWWACPRWAPGRPSGARGRSHPGAGGALLRGWADPSPGSRKRGRERERRGTVRPAPKQPALWHHNGQKQGKK